MLLQPADPPSRTRAKARSATDEIFRLHGVGYSLRQIQQALAAVGLVVSRSTVHRELVRARAGHHSVAGTRRPVAAVSAPAGQAHAAPPQHATPPAAKSSPPRDQPSGKELAADFFGRTNTNPLFKKPS